VIARRTSRVYREHEAVVFPQV